LGVKANINSDELFSWDVNPIMNNIADDFFNRDFSSFPSPDFSINVYCPYNTFLGSRNIGLFSSNLSPFESLSVINNLEDLVMDVNHPNFVVSSVEVLDSVGSVELIPTSTSWVLIRVSDSSAGSAASESEDLSILSNRNV
jgi:hypothetical protein